MTVELIHSPSLAKVPSSPALHDTPGGRPTSRPRLLWRGSLLLQDGTALPGVAFISHSHPIISGALTPASSSKITQHAAQSGNGFSSMAREIQAPPRVVVGDEDDDLASNATTLMEDPSIEADLCLALEMARHRPLRITGLETVPTAAEANESQSKGKRDTVGGTASAGVRTTVRWEQSIGMRMYIDPAERRTLDFFRRKFCLNEELTDGPHSHSRTVVMVSLEANPGRVDDLPSAFGSSSIQDIAIFAASRCRQHSQSLDLVLGRKVVVKRKPAAAESRFLLRDPFSARPDYHVPRNNSFITKLQTRPRPTSTTTHVPANGTFAIPSHPKNSRPSEDSSDVITNRFSLARNASSCSSLVDLQRVGKGNTPGRRGEKRPLRHASSTSSIQMNEMEPSSSSFWLGPSSPSRKRSAADTMLAPCPSKRSLSRSLSVTPGPGSPPPGTCSTSGGLASSASPNEREQANRAILKKLVHHQLLGRGYEKEEEEYKACYGAAYNGTAVALRATLASEVVDRARAAAVVTRHLDLYLSPLALPDQQE